VLISTSETSRLDRAFAAGAERVTAWEELLDRINVFPVTDFDTGRNLAISLSPLLRTGDKKSNERAAVIKDLLLYSRGNSGIIASRFLSEALKAQTVEELGVAFRRGRDSAWKSIADPRPGTMLTVFDALVEALEAAPVAGGVSVDGILDRLEEAVLATPEFLPKLKQAGVVDSGALGMFIFFEGFFRSLEGGAGAFRPIATVFNRHLNISPAYHDDSTADFCVSAVFEKGKGPGNISAELAALGDSIVVLDENDFVKVHFHTDDEQGARRKIASLGRVLEWSADDIAAQKESGRESGPAGGAAPAAHVMTDAAGSLTRGLARKSGITLLNSYITYGGRSLPETHVDPADLYSAMRGGVRASTSQASVFERRQYYESAVELHGKVLYLCVGSVYTGNYEAAMAWKKENDAGDNFIIVDTGAASGRLAVMALSCARFLQGSPDLKTFLDFAGWAVGNSSELIFIDRLQYLAAGGRLSKTGAFFGDLINMKPVISPLPDGARKVGAVRSQSDQVKFALDKIGEARLRARQGRLFVMLEYTDNAGWLEREFRPLLEKELPGSGIIVQPMSLTTGVHVGPGAWGIAWQPVSE
jgi:DegV family protein with EDD domain